MAESRTLGTFNATGPEKPLSMAEMLGGIKAVTTFLRVALKLGVLDAERREFWRFFIQAVHKHHDRMVELL